MSVDCLVRKRIWEVDCLSLDAVIGASFDWRELANLLEGSGHGFNLEEEEDLLEVQIYRTIHQHCHSENATSVAVETLLNRWHWGMIEELDGMTLADIARFVVREKLNSRKLAGVIWAIGTDARDGFDCIRRCFHQRLRIFLIKKLQTQ